MTGNILEQAKQGNPNAIAALMSRSMKSQGIDVKASLDGRCLDVILEAEKVPTPQATISFIRKGMTNLGVDSIEAVRVSAYQTGESTPAWQEDIILQDPSISPPPMSVSSPLMEADETSNYMEEERLPEDLLDNDLSSDGYDALPEQNFSNDEYGSDLPEEVTEFTPDDEYSMSDYERDEEEMMDDEDRMDMAEEEPQPKKKSSALPLLLLLLLALGLGGFYLYSQKPELLAGIPGLKGLLPASSDPNTAPGTAPAEGEAAPEAAAPTETPAEPPAAAGSAPAATANDPFPEAVRKATSAAQLTQTASTSQEWGQVVADWQAAIELMQSVPESNPKYSVAQDRIPMYQKNLEYAQQQAGQ
ncbi:MAG TPA: hypothetical protein IGS17_13265 [Oscillatoriales cyanobacterium M59_W2019_021]|nr:MAG: hypothetical protein D6728_16790 [Cyanobacteria bacterium J055]HIK32766.1 hypothetical protein [Oscillatoriales cyanobacterium M4454_W2019_049]HIK51874.1 hypothetical protein [Oscillatoriales cyanobacterium M59_W2019_021]